MKKYLAALIVSLLITPSLLCAATPEAELASRLQTVVSHAESTAVNMLKKPYQSVDFSAKVLINMGQEEAAIYQAILKNKNNEAFLNAVERSLTQNAAPNKFKAQLYLKEVLASAKNDKGPVRAFDFVSGHETFNKRIAEELLIKGRISFNTLVTKIEKRLMVSRQKALLLALSAEAHYAQSVVKAASTAQYQAAKRLALESYLKSKSGNLSRQADLNVQKALNEHLRNLKYLRETSQSKVSSLNYALSKKELTQISTAIEKHPHLQASFAGLAGRSYLERAAVKVGKVLPAAVLITIISRLAMPDIEDIKKSFGQKVQAAAKHKAQEQQRLADIINEHPGLIVVAASGSESNLKSVTELLNGKDGFIKHSLSDIVSYISESAASTEALLEDKELLNNYMASLQNVNISIQKGVDSDTKDNFVKELKMINPQNQDFAAPNDNTRVTMPKIILNINSGD